MRTCGHRSLERMSTKKNKVKKCLCEEHVHVNVKVWDFSVRKRKKREEHGIICNLQDSLEVVTECVIISWAKEKKVHFELAVSVPN